MRVLALDLGEKRIGIAVSDAGGTLAYADGVMARRSWQQVLADLRAKVDAVQAEQIVVGLPLRMDGTEGPAAISVREFVERLRAVVSVPIAFQDERLSTA